MHLHDGVQVVTRKIIKPKFSKETAKKVNRGHYEIVTSLSTGNSLLPSTNMVVSILEAAIL